MTLSRTFAYYQEMGVVTWFLYRGRINICLPRIHATDAYYFILSRSIFDALPVATFHSLSSLAIAFLPYCYADTIGNIRLIFILGKARIVPHQRSIGSLAPGDPNRQCQLVL